MDPKSEKANLALPPSPLYKEPKDPNLTQVSINGETSPDATVNTSTKKHHSKKDKSKSKKKKKKSPRKELQSEEISTTVGPTTSSPQTSSSDDDMSPKVRSSTVKVKNRERSSTIANDMLQSSKYQFNPFIDKPSYCFLTPREVSPITSPLFTHSRGMSTLNKKSAVIAVPASNSPKAQSLRTKPQSRPGIPDFFGRDSAGPDSGGEDNNLMRLRSYSNSSGLKPKPSGCFVTLDSNNNITGSNTSTSGIVETNTVAKTSGKGSKASTKASKTSSNTKSAKNSSSPISATTTITTPTTTPTPASITTINKKSLKLNLTNVHQDDEPSRKHKKEPEISVKLNTKVTLTSPSLSMLIAGTASTSGSSSYTTGSTSTPSATPNTGLLLSPSSATITVTQELTEKSKSPQNTSKKKKKKRRRKRKDDGDDNDAAEWDTLLATLDARADPMRHVKIWGKALFRIDAPFSAAKLPKDGKPFAKTICRVIFKRKRAFSSGGKMVDVGAIERMEQDGSFVKLVDLGACVTKVMQSWDPVNNRFALVVSTETSSVVVETLPAETSKDWFSVVERVHKKITRQQDSF